MRYVTLALLALIVLLPQSSAGGGADKMYITYEGGNCGVYRCDLDGANRTDLTGVAGYCSSSGIGIDSEHGKMYLAGDSPGVIWSANLDGSGAKNLTATDSSPYNGVAVDSVAGYIYWTVRASSGVNDHRIKRANLDGTNPVTLLSSGFLNPEAIDLDLLHGKMYWVDWGDDSGGSKVQRADLNGSNLETLVTGLVQGTGIAVDAYHNRMYWTERGNHHGIWTASLDGTGKRQIISQASINYPWSIDLDVARGKMYFTAPLDGSVWRANLDGTQLVQIPYSGGRSPYGIALDVAPIPEPSTFTLLGMGAAGLLGFAWRRRAST